MPPRGLALGEVGAEAGQVVTGGAEVVVDDVEQDRQPERVRPVDEGLEVPGPPVGPCGPEPLAPFLSPPTPCWRKRRLISLA